MSARRYIAGMVAIALFVSIFAACTGPAPSSEAAPVSSASAPQPAASTPEPAPQPLSATEFLTGLPKDDSYPEGKRITAVMVNNIDVCRPLSGLSAADVLVEIRVEGGITRFMALYDDYATIPRVGPVRSSRDQFFQLLLPTYGFLVHIGESVVQEQYRNDWKYSEFDMDGELSGELIAWDQERRAAGFAQEHTAYTSGELISSYIASHALDDKRTYRSGMFNFGAPGAPAFVPGGGTATDIEVTHSPDYITSFQYDTGAGQYLMSMYNASKKATEPTVDENTGTQLAFENLMILFVPIDPYAGHEDKDLQYVDYGAQGVGIYFTQGAFMPVLWRKEGPPDPLRLYLSDGSGQQVEVNPGKTYLAMVDDNGWSGFYQDVINKSAAPPSDGASVSSPDASAADTSSSS